MDMDDEQELQTDDFDTNDTQDAAEDAEQEEGWFDGDVATDSAEAGETETESADLYDPIAEYDSEELYDMSDEQEAFEEDHPEADGETDTTADPSSEELEDMAEEQETEEQDESEMREWAMEQHLENDARNEIEHEASYDY
ncbi:MAG: hypothetical protein RR450_07960 [Oscillospiraceae bacterium]